MDRSLARRPAIAASQTAMADDAPPAPPGRDRHCDEGVQAVHPGVDARAISGTIALADTPADATVRFGMPARCGPPSPALVYLGHLAPGSRRTMRGALDTMAAMLTGDRHDAAIFPWCELRYQHTQLVRAHLLARYAPATANKHLAALRGVLKEAWRLGLIAADDYHRAVDLAVVRGVALPRGRALAEDELRALFASCAASAGPAGARDAALLALLYGTGARRSEVVALDVADIALATGAVVIRSGKGRQSRVAYIAGGGGAAVAGWLACRGREAGPLLHPVDKGGRIARRRMTDQAVLAILRRRASAAGVRRFSPHDLRRSFIGDLLDAGADIATVQRLVGHSSVTTTARYDRRDEVTKHAAAGLLRIPYASGVVPDCETSSGVAGLAVNSIHHAPQTVAGGGSRGTGR